MAGFHEVQFPTNISKGSAGGPERRTQIVTLNSGYEERNATWAHSRRSYDASMGLRSIDDLHDVLQFWEARGGQLYGFRFKDWTDYRSGKPRSTPTMLDMPLQPVDASGNWIGTIGQGDGSTKTFQLVKAYTSGSISYVRPIRKPVSGTVLVSVAGVSSVAWTLDTTTGILTFTAAPGAGVQVKAGFEFDVPVRFSAEKISVSYDAFQAGAIQAIEMIEIRV